MNDNKKLATLIVVYNGEEYRFSVAMSLPTINNTKFIKYKRDIIWLEGLM